MALIGQRRVLSTALPWNKNLLHTCWMNRLALPSNSNPFDSCVAYCSLHHIGLVHSGMVHAVVCLLWVGIVSKSMHVVWHGQMNLVVVVVPIQCYPDVSFACSITRKFVVFFKCILEMLCMFFANNFMPKTSTTSVNCIGLVSCYQRPGTNLLCWYLCLLRHFLRSLLANNSTCGRLHMPCLVLM